jgi:tetratricopeptide (TPR) repeat protein
MGKVNVQAESWLEEAYPAMHYMLLALDGSEPALTWLRDNAAGVDVLARAMIGKRKALASLHADEPGELDDLFELVDNEDVCTWLKERRPDVALLFAAIRGEAEALASLRRRRPALGRLALVVRDLHEKQAQHNGNGAIEGEAAADMGCLIGEMHLEKGDYEKAIAAFTRVIETRPAPDLYEGRARAYRGLAQRDERRAEELRAAGRHG